MQKISKLKRKQAKRLLAISLSFSSLILFNSSCYEPIEGCLDINSSNYEVSADRACDSCCVFPAFNMNVSQVFGGEAFSLGDTIVNSIGSELILTDYEIIVSMFELGSGSQKFTVFDSIEVECNGVTNYERNDMVRITNTSKLISIGTLNNATTYDNIEFLIGLNDCYHDAGNTNLDSDSRINTIDTLYQSGVGFRTMMLEFNDSLSYELIGKPEGITISRSIASSNIAGSPLVLSMNIDFGTWLSDFDLSEDQESAKIKLRTNANKAITFTE